MSTAWNGKAFLPHMIRWLKTDIGNIGFHGIPRHVADGSRLREGLRVGNQAVRRVSTQADLDADFMWDFAQDRHQGRRSLAGQSGLTFCASSPLRPGAMSNSTVWPSCNDL